MDPLQEYPYPESPSPSSATRRENQIQGPRPSPLRLSRDSHKISKKPPMAPKPPQQPLLPAIGNQPIIIYSVSPKPIFVEASKFRSIVQHLTGRDASGSKELRFSGEIPVSPAARMAAIERTSPGDRDRRERRSEIDFLEEFLMDEERNIGFDVVDVSQNPGILSPAPVNLPAISAAMFSPVMESQTGFGFGEIMMSPFFGSNLMSPSTMFLTNTSIFSPSPSSLGELFNFDNF